AGSVVGLDFDPMLAKGIAHRPTRSEAAGALAAGLERLHIGGITTNAAFLARVLRHEAFLAGPTATDFIDGNGLAQPRPPDDHQARRTAVTAALWLQGRNRADAPVLGGLPSGWRNARLPHQHVALTVAGVPVEVHYQLRRDGSFVV